MRLGVLLPLFQHDAAPALRRAEEVDEAGLDGVFGFDHLWPMGSPERPALAPLPVLARVAHDHPDLMVGPLVARIGLGSTSHLIDGLQTLHDVAPGRVIAGLGTGDQLSRAENEAYGLAYPSADERRAQLRDAIRAVQGDMEVWVGGGSAQTHQLVREEGATLNLWNRSPAQIAQAAGEGPVTWAGPSPDDVPNFLTALQQAGATWAVFESPVNLSELVAWREAHAE